MTKRIICLLLLLPTLALAVTNVARTKTWTAEKLYAVDLNAEFDGLVSYINTNIAFVTNITATAARINQIGNNNFLFTTTFSAAVTDSADHTMRTGWVYTNRGKAILDSAAIDTLYATAQGYTKVVFGAGFVPDTTYGKRRNLGLPTARFEIHADTSRAGIADFDTIAGTTVLGSTPVMRPSADLLGQIGLPTFRFNSFTGDTVRAQVGAIDSLTGTTISDSWILKPKTDNTGTIGAGPAFRFRSGSFDTIRATVVDTANFGVVGRANVQTSAIDSTKILALTVAGSNLRNDAVDSTKIRDASVSGPDLSSMLSGGHTFTDSLISNGNFRKGSSSFIVNGNTVAVGQVKVSANTTQGLIIQQNASDDELIEFKSTDVAHGMTTRAETDTYLGLRKMNPTGGGPYFRGYNVDYRGLILEGNVANDTTLKATNTLGIVYINAAKKSGSSTGAASADAALMTISNSGTTRFIFDAEGTGHADDVWTDSAFDLRELYDVVLPDSSRMPSYWRSKGKPYTAQVGPKDPICYSIEGATVTVDVAADNRFVLTTLPYQVVTGVVSYGTAQLGDPFGNIRRKFPELQLDDYANPTPVGIVGLIPTKICNEGGAITRGDILVSSSKKGVAMKGTPALIANPRCIVGVAMMNFGAVSPDSVGIINIQR